MCPLLLIAAICGGCSFEFRPPTPFAGTYELSSGCELALADDKAEASCPTDGITVDVAIKDGEVTFNKVVVTEELNNTACWLERVCELTFSGTVKRLVQGEGTTYDGRFAALAGSWEGQMAMKRTCSKELAATSQPKWCDQESDALTYTVTASVTAHSATVNWKDSGGAQGTFKGEETKGGVRVGDNFYPRQGATPSSSSDGSSVTPDLGSAAGEASVSGD